MKRVPLILLALLAVVGGASYALTRGASDTSERAAACPPGYVSAEQRESLERSEQRMMAARGYRETTERQKAPVTANCQLRKHPEPVAELGAINAHRTVRQTAPARAIRPGAYAAASRSRQRAAGTRRTVPGADGSWTPAGSTPLVNDDPNYDEVNLLGLADISGRVANFAYDGANDHLYAAVGEGGVWQSDDVGGSWRSIADNLPTQAVAAVAVAPPKDGRPATLIALTGDDIYGGGSSTPGIGAFRTTDGGATWEHATGIPSGVLGFAVAVDPTNADVIYAATGAGLYRSTDAGRSFDNVDLPTGKTNGVPNGAPLSPDCTGKGIVAGCFLANMVTDVVVQAPDTFGHTGGRVVAAVGWRAGNKAGPDGKVESPNNGIYVSDTGQRGTFGKVNPNTSGFGSGTLPGGATNQDAIGRTELGIASGPQQNHNFLYAIVQDASAFKAGEVSGIDVPEQSPAAAPSNTYLRGVYVSSDLGQTWTRMAGATELQAPTNGSALTPTQCASGLYCPGIQAWYNAWIKPDPTQANASGVPTRLTFGLEEVWQNDDAPPLGRQPQSGPSSFKVIGRYYAGETCQGLTQPIQPCPTNRGDPGSTTTHPDQHGGLYIPRGNGAVTLVVGNDGGAYTQTAAAGQEFSNTKWGRGANKGFYTLLPYDAQIAKDGVIYSGLQDNGEMKITPDGKQTGVFGGDGGFSAVDPDNSNVAWEEYTNAAISLTTDGGKTWSDASPPSDTYMFINPFTMDPGDADHLLTGGTKVYETTSGPRTTSSGWTQVFDLGSEPSGAPRQTSATDVRSVDAGGGPGLPTAPKSPDDAWSGGSQTKPGPTTDPGNATDPALTFFAPGTYDDHPFTIRAGAGNASVTVAISAPDPNDWDLYVYRKEGSNLVEVGRSASTGTPPEKVVIANPKAGDYIVRAHNYQASGTYNGSVTFDQRTVQTPGVTDAAYVGFCGYCEPLIHRPFANGIATNVGGPKAPKPLTGDGWHLAGARGLPRRYITSVQVDPGDARTVYATVGGYSRRWIPPGALGEDTSGVGSGHVFRSTDAGETFTDISGDLPDAPANFSLVRRGQLIVATDVGVYAARGTGGGHYDLLGNGLPTVSAYSLELKPKSSDSEQDQLIIATYGRGVWRYNFSDAEVVPSSSIKIGPQTGGPTACAASGGFRSVKVTPRRRGARVAFARRLRKPVTVDVFQTSRGRTVLKERLVARFSKRGRSFTWNGRANRRGRKVSDGYYFVRYRLRVDAKHEDLRRVVLRRVNGRLRLRPAFYRRASCGTLASYKLERPVFGGRGTRKLGASFRLARAAQVRVTVLRGKRVVRTFKRTSYKAGRTYRLAFPAKGRPRGDYRFKLDLVRGKEKLASTLTSRRL